MMNELSMNMMHFWTYSVGTISSLYKRARQFFGAKDPVEEHPLFKDAMVPQSWLDHLSDSWEKLSWYNKFYIYTGGVLFASVLGTFTGSVILFSLFSLFLISSTDIFLKSHLQKRKQHAVELVNAACDHFEKSEPLPKPNDADEIHAAVSRVEQLSKDLKNTNKEMEEYLSSQSVTEQSKNNLLSLEISPKQNMPSQDELELQINFIKERSLKLQMIKAALNMQSPVLNQSLPRGLVKKLPISGDLNLSLTGELASMNSPFVMAKRNNFSSIPIFLQVSLKKEGYDSASAQELTQFIQKALPLENKKLFKELTICFFNKTIEQKAREVASLIVCPNLVSKENDNQSLSGDDLVPMKRSKSLMFANSREITTRLMYSHQVQLNVLSIFIAQCKDHHAACILFLANQSEYLTQAQDKLIEIENRQNENTEFDMDAIDALIADADSVIAGNSSAQYNLGHMP